ncbi:glycosyltransferase involved in cell wall biosynthesis [Gelidibacter algens]|uniref:Glycosyltransferase involved in cell wall biosynthesis n=1 Tax=Gelidibacter algens TaxID=49280 RepID=A0A1A7QSG7_9FLAO|nr:glycosyltransferase family 1 protein [Gelidibacter algens]OBX22154.1 glycosyl transferase family 1 [Gelidibacter algens]RAJ19986.1 glycosyltransferase involved in cell wall biosynthesis [Gelidibacter algens]
MRKSKAHKSIFLETHNINNLYSGFGQFNFNLARALSEETEFLGEHQIVLNCNNVYIKKELGNRLSYNRYWQISRYPLFRIKKKYNLWHSVNQNTKIEPFSRETPYLLTVHDINFIEEDTGGRLNFRINQFKDKIKRSNGVVYISEFAKSMTHQHFNVPSVPEYVIYNGNTLNNKSMILTENSYTKFLPTRPFIFSIGQLVEKKNFHTLIEMLRILSNVDLVIAGDLKTDYAEILKQLIQKYRLQTKVFLLGSITESDKIFYYKNCLAFAFPSLREGFGLPVIEAMTFGKPIFLSSRTSLPEIGGVDSFYWENFEPQYMAKVFEEGMSKFEANKDWLTSSYINRSLQFSWSNAAKQYTEVYKSIL